MRRTLVLLLALAATVSLTAVGLAQAASTRAAAKTIKGVVGPGFTISVNKKTVKAGTYTFVVQDKATIHNFHITGPGVNRSTKVSGTGTTTWKLKLKKGTYRIVCDPHATSMKTTLKVT
jgi:plastocyanin